VSDGETVLSGPPQGGGGPPGPADIDEKVSAEAVRRGLITPSQGNAAREEARSKAVPVLEVLLRRGFLSEESAREIDEETKEDFVPGYRVVSKLGEGGMGIVYRALQKRLDREVALKVVMPRLAGDPTYLKRFEREARAVAKLNHPSIVAAYDYGESNGRVFLAMELVSGVNCADWIRKNGPMEEGRALGVVRDVASGLAHACAAGIIHRDIKPGNILLADRRPGDTASGTSSGAKLTDLGLARMGNQGGATELTAAGAILGTPGFMAPEQAFGKEVDHRADIYALGATLYQLATGQRPFEASTPVAVIARQQSDRLPDPRDLRPSCSPGLSALLQGMLSRDSSTRYQDYRGLLADIDRVRAGQAPGLPLPPPDQRSLAEPTGAAVPGTVALPARAPSVAPQEPTLLAPSAASVPPVAAPAPAPPAPPAKPSKAPWVFAGAILVVAVFAAIPFLSSGKGDAPAGTGVSPGPGPAPPDSGKPAPATAPATAASSPEEEFPEEAERAVGKDIADGNVRAAFTRMVEAIRKLQGRPAAQRRAVPARLQALMAKTRLALEDRVADHMKNGEYAEALDLAKWAGDQVKDLPGAKFDDPRLENQLKTLERIADRGPAERAALRAAKEARDRDDPVAVLAALDGFETKYDFSPDMDTAKRLVAWADAEAPLVRVESDPSGALLLVGGKEMGKTPQSFRARVGRDLEAELRLAGYGTEKRTLSVKRDAVPSFRVGLKPAAPPDPEPAVVLVPAGDPRPLWTGAGLGAWSGAGGGEWTVSDPETKTLLEGVEKPEPAAVLRGKSTSLGAARLDLAGFVRGADGWRLQWQMIGAGRRNGNTARVEMQFAVLESGSSLVLGIDDQDAYLGTRNGAAGELVRTHRMQGPAASAPHTFTVVFHGDVFVASVDGKRVGSAAAPKDLSAGRTIRVAVEGGVGFFSDIELTRMKRP
jgi:serine/threonine-protein kinase